MLPKTIRKIAYKTGMSLDIVSLSLFRTDWKRFFLPFFSKRRNIKFFLFFIYFTCESKVSQAAVPIRGHNWFVSQPPPQCQSRSKSIRKRKGKDGYHTRKLVNSDWVKAKRKDEEIIIKKEAKEWQDYFCTTNRSYWVDNCGLLNR